LASPERPPEFEPVDRISRLCRGKVDNASRVAAMSAAFLTALVAFITATKTKLWVVLRR